MKPLDLTCSIVLYKNDPHILQKAIDSVLQSTLSLKLTLLDNSPDDRLSVLAREKRVEYIHCPSNLGFGKAHNIALREAFQLSKNHLVLNPDVSFPPGTLEKLHDFMEGNPKVGLLLPKVYDYKNDIQPLCKRLPAPLDLILRRFGSGVSRLFQNRLVRYEMQDQDYNKPFEAPSMSGCFMFFRVEALKKIGLFDERFFMYLEDVDLSRRMLTHYKNVYFPYVHIFHEHARESYKLNKLLFIHIKSAIKYFNKWGWIVDPQRDTFNYDARKFTNLHPRPQMISKESVS